MNTQLELERDLARRYAQGLGSKHWERPGMSCKDGGMQYRYTKTGWIHEYPNERTHKTDAVAFTPGGFASNYAFGHSLERAVCNGPNVEDPLTVLGLLAELPEPWELVYIPKVATGPASPALNFQWSVVLLREDKPSSVLGQGKTKVEAILRALLAEVGK